MQLGIQAQTGEPVLANPSVAGSICATIELMDNQEIHDAIQKLRQEIQSDFASLVNAVNAAGSTFAGRAGDGGDGGFMSGGAGGGGWNPFGSGDSGGHGGQGPTFVNYDVAPQFLEWLRGVAPELADAVEIEDAPTWWRRVIEFLRESAQAVPADVAAAMIVASLGID